MVQIVNNISKMKYQIQRRYYKDAFWWNAWFSGIKPEWSDWEDFKNGSYDDIKSAHVKEDELNKAKSYIKHRVEYRLIKNG